MKVKCAVLCAVVLSLTVLSCAVPESRTEPLSEADVAALQSATEAYRDAEAVNDWEAVTMLYTDDAIRLLPKGPTVRGRAAILEEFKSRPSRIVEYDQRLEEAQGTGDIAFVRGVFTYVAEVRGDTLRGSGKYLAVYRRQTGGSWLIDRDIFNYDKPDTAAT